MLIYYFLYLTILTDSFNNFVKISFDKETSSISLKFLNQPKANKKFYSVKYGPKTPDCMYLPSHLEGYLSNSNFISLELNLDLKDTEICFLTLVGNGTDSVGVEGIYKAGTC